MQSSCAATAVPPPEVDVVALSPPELLGCNGWYVCEACGRGFPRHHNLRQHRRRYAAASDNLLVALKRKRVFVCPEPGCRHHAPSDALANLTCLKKHFRRKHGRHGLWACGRASGASAAVRVPGAHVVSSAMASPTAAAASVEALGPSLSPPTPPARTGAHNLELQLMPPGESFAAVTCCAPPHPPAPVPRLDLSLGLGGAGYDAAAARLMVEEAQEQQLLAKAEKAAAAEDRAQARLMVEEAREQLLLAMAEKAAAEEAREQARRRAEMAEVELANAQRLRQQAQVELARAHAARQLVCETLLQVTNRAAAGSSTPGLPH